MLAPVKGQRSGSADVYRPDGAGTELDFLSASSVTDHGEVAEKKCMLKAINIS